MDRRYIPAPDQEYVQVAVHHDDGRRGEGWIKGRWQNHDGSWWGAYVEYTVPAAIAK